jgi:HPt (histidine-containing phosphotransfer) domain-containing protein
LDTSAVLGKKVGIDSLRAFRGHESAKDLAKELPKEPAKGHRKGHQMSRPSPAAELRPIDLDHLRRATFGDAGLEREVLGMFLTQAARLVGALAEKPPDAVALAHTLKGSARAIGASRVAERASSLEAAIRDGGDPARAHAELDAAVADACMAIAALLDQA